MIKMWWKRRELEQAIGENDVDCVRALAEGGLDLNHARRGHSPLSMAVWRVFSDTNRNRPADRRVVDCLIAHGASARAPGNETLLVAAVLSRQNDLIDLALAGGQNIHRRSMECSPLEAALRKNDPETMRYLIERGAGKEDVDLLGCRWYALSSATIELLLEMGADIPLEVIGQVKNGNWDAKSADESI